MIRLTQSTFAEPSNDELKALKDEPLVIHQRQNSRLNKHLVIFVHGLRGKRYGKKATWGYFPRFIYEDFIELDIALYSYRTLEQRLKFGKSVEIEDQAKILAGIIRDLKDYESVILIGHSMGGLLCKAVIAHFVTTNQLEPLLRIQGLILMATPQLGSLWVSRLLSLVSNDFWTLRRHGKFVADMQNVFANHINLDEKIFAKDKTLIPGWIVQAASDFWVDKLSAGIGLPEERKKTVHGLHTEIVKPLHKDDDAYNFAKNCIASCLASSSVKKNNSSKLPRNESINFICKYTGQNDIVAANTLAEAFSDSPQELTEVAAIIKEKGISISDYFRLPLQQQGRSKQRLIKNHNLRSETFPKSNEGQSKSMGTHTLKRQE